VLREVTVEVASAKRSRVPRRPFDDSAIMSREVAAYPEQSINRKDRKDHKKGTLQHVAGSPRGRHLIDGQFLHLL
jgi:hypothetical protein